MQDQAVETVAAWAPIADAICKSINDTFHKGHINVSVGFDTYATDKISASLDGVAKAINNVATALKER